jgi:geranylgeranyl diphosphate synthase type II
LYKSLSALFNKTALEVCEGQQYDFDFETSNDVTVGEYINMIRLKTAVLVATSLKFGAMIAAVDKKDQENIYQFGINLGLAFQLQDDYLDVFSEEDFGKQKAGDIKENKKTILYLKALELADKNDKKELINLYQSKVESDNKVEIVVSIFKKYNIPQLIEKEVKRYTDLAIANIEDLQLDDDKKEVLKMLAGQLMARKI